MPAAPRRRTTLTRRPHRLRVTGSPGGAAPAAGGQAVHDRPAAVPPPEAPPRPLPPGRDVPGAVRTAPEPAQPPRQRAAREPGAGRAPKGLPVGRAALRAPRAAPERPGRQGPPAPDGDLARPTPRALSRRANAGGRHRPARMTIDERTPLCQRAHQEPAAAAAQASLPTGSADSQRPATIPDTRALCRTTWSRSWWSSSAAASNGSQRRWSTSSPGWKRPDRRLMSQ